MIHGQQHFIEGFLAAANFLGGDEYEKRRASQTEACTGEPGVLPQDQEELFKQMRLSLDDYLAIPTFIRQGKVFSQPVEA